MLKRSLRRVEALFHQTADLAPEERSRFLDTHCAGDTELRSAVEQLLKYDTSTGGSGSFLASPIKRKPELLLEASPARVLPTIPGYELIEELGRGGMGIVYKARQIALDRLVALKMLQASLACTAEHLVRFRTEAEALARMQHPNIVQVYDVGERDGQPYISMEYIAGPSLADRVAGVPQPARPAAQLVEVVARAVDAVHRCGVLHRDLKPANILLRPKEDTPGSKPAHPHGHSLSPLTGFEPKVSDFGLAKLVRDQPAHRNLTEPGQALGTPSYMAPEQAWGRIDSLGPATDVYALGAILYEMLTGRPPFEGETPTETILQLLSQEPVPPTRLRPKLPRDLETICLKCLEKEPRRRYASAAALAEDLQRFQAGEPIEARPISEAERAYRWCFRHPLVASLLAATVFLGSALIGTVIFYNVQLQRALSVSEQAVESERQQLVQRDVAIGMRNLEDGEAPTALLWFTEALRLDERDAQREQAHRIRIAMAFQRCPGLTGLLVPEEPVIGVRMSEAGSWVVTESLSIRVWDLMTGEITGPSLHSDSAELKATFSPDGNFLAAACADNTVRVWDRNTGKLYPPLRPGGPVNKVAFGAQNRILLTRRDDFVVQRWELATGQSLPLEGQSEDRPHYSTISEDGKWILLVDANRMGQEWNAETGKPFGDPLKLEHDVVHAALSPDGHRVALVDKHNQVRIRELPTGKLICGPFQQAGVLNEVAFSPQGDRILTIGDQTVQLWQISTGRLLVPPLRHDGVVTQAQFSPDGRLVVSGGSDNKALVWQVETGRLLVPPLEHHGSLAYAAFSPDSRQVLTIGRDDIARLWKLPEAAGTGEGEVLAEAPPQPEKTANPGNRRLAELDHGNAVQVIDAATGMPVSRPLRHRSNIEHAVLSPDGLLVLTVSDDNTAQLWDAASGARLNPPCPHKGTVLYAAFSPDGRRFITASDDRTARVWETATSEPLTPPLRCSSTVLRAYFLRDGYQAIAVCADGGVRAWNLTPDDRPTATLILLAHVLAGSRVDEAYGILPLDDKSLRSAWQKLKGVAAFSRAP